MIPELKHARVQGSLIMLGFGSIASPHSTIACCHEQVSMFGAFRTSFEQPFRSRQPSVSLSGVSVQQGSEAEPESASSRRLRLLPAEKALMRSPQEIRAFLVFPDQHCCL